MTTTETQTPERAADDTQAKPQRTAWLPWWWHVAIASVFAVGLALLVLEPPDADGFSKLASRVSPEHWRTFAGILLVAIAVSHFSSYLLRRAIRSLLQLTGDSTPADSWSPTLVGICESLMYPLSMFAGKAEFIGVWLAIKVAGQWARWGGADTAADLNEGRRRFNAFLVGNAVSIMFGVITWVALKLFVTP